MRRSPYSSGTVCGDYTLATNALFAGLYARTKMLAFVLSPLRSFKVKPQITRQWRYPQNATFASAAPRNGSGSAHVVQPASSVSIWDAARQAPPEAGVYRFLDATGKVLYIGKARSLRARIRQYISRDDQRVSGVAPNRRLNARMASMIGSASCVDFMVTQSESAALALEASLVRELLPPYNVLLKDDRRHPFALITFSDDYPRIILTRTRNLRNKKDKLYGPFVDESKLRRVLAAIHTVFPLRQRPKPLHPHRTCMNYDLGRCPGVCQQLISAEDYATTLRSVDMLLTGRLDEVIGELRASMQRFSTLLEYEQAARDRDRIALLEQVFTEDSSIETSTAAASSSFIANSEAAASIVDVDPSVSRDVAAVSSDPLNGTVAKAVIVQVRGGKVINRLVFSAQLQDSEPTAQFLAAVLSDHYASATHPMEIPGTVVLASAIPAEDVKLLRGALTEKRGKAVQIKLADMGTSPLARIAQRNADMEVDLEFQRETQVAQELRSLSSLLLPYFPQLVKHGPLGTVDDEFEGESEQALQLHRIETYDISHTAGANAVGSMAVFLDGTAAPSEHRRYFLDEDASSVGHPDDFESIRVCLQKRFRGLPIGSLSNALASSSLPDLLVIDGGKGQLSTALGVLTELGLEDVIPVVGLAKREEEVFVPSQQEPINVDKSTGDVCMSGGVRLLCRARDEGVSRHQNELCFPRPDFL